MAAADPWERARLASMVASGSLAGSFTGPALQAEDWGQATVQADFVDGSSGGGLCSFVEVGRSLGWPPAGLRSSSGPTSCGACIAAGSAAASRCCGGWRRRPQLPLTKLPPPTPPAGSLQGARGAHQCRGGQRAAVERAGTAVRPALGICAWCPGTRGRVVAGLLLLAAGARGADLSHNRPCCRSCHSRCLPRRRRRHQRRCSTAMQRSPSACSTRWAECCCSSHATCRLLLLQCEQQLRFT